VDSDKLLVRLGHYYAAHEAKPYGDPALIIGELVLQNEGPDELQLLRIRLHAVSYCTILHVRPASIPRLAATHSVAVGFRLSTRERTAQVSACITGTVPGPSGFSYAQPLLIDCVAADRQERRIFVSYASVDLPRIQPLLPEVRVRGTVWMAKYDIRPWEWFPNLISSALGSTNIFIVFLSRASVNSGWVQDEIRLAVGAPTIKTLILSVSLEHCNVPPELEQYPIVNCWRNDGDAGRRLGEALDGLLLA
jgi:TIR domain